MAGKKKRRPRLGTGMAERAASAIERRKRLQQMALEGELPPPKKKRRRKRK